MNECMGGCGKTGPEPWMCAECYEGARILDRNAIRLAREKSITDLRANVMAFHEDVIGGEMPTRPSVPDDGTARRRLRLIAEEFFEVMRAAYGKDDPYDVLVSLGGAESVVMSIIAEAPLAVDLPRLAQELADLMYVCEGCFIGFGIDSRPVHAEVQRANMAKVGGPVRADGKRLRPPGWTPPDIKGIIEKQMKG